MNVSAAWFPAQIVAYALAEYLQNGRQFRKEFFIFRRKCSIHRFQLFCETIGSIAVRRTECSCIEKKEKRAVAVNGNHEFRYAFPTVMEKGTHCTLCSCFRIPRAFFMTAPVPAVFQKTPGHAERIPVYAAIRKIRRTVPVKQQTMAVMNCQPDAVTGFNACQWRSNP